MKRMLLLTAGSVNRIIYPILENVVKPSFRSPRKIQEVQDILSRLVLVPSVSIDTDAIYDINEAFGFAGLALGKRLRVPQILYQQVQGQLTLRPEVLNTLLVSVYSFQAISYTASGYFAYLLLRERKLVTKHVQMNFMTSTDGHLSQIKSSIYQDLQPELTGAMKKLLPAVDRRVQKQLLTIPTITTETLNDTVQTAKVLYQALR